MKTVAICPCPFILFVKNLMVKLDEESDGSVWQNILFFSWTNIMEKTQWCLSAAEFW